MARVKAVRSLWGFALMELLLSITILAIILGITMPFLVAAERAFRQSQSRLDALQNARTAAMTIAEGLRRAVAIASIGGGTPATQVTFDVDEWNFGTHSTEPWHGAVSKTIRTTYRTTTMDGQTWAELSETDPTTGEVRSALIAGPLESLQFVGYKEDGVTQTTDPLKIRSLEVTVGIASPNSPEGRIRYSTRVFCRCDTTPALAIVATGTSSITLGAPVTVIGDMFVGGSPGNVSIPKNCEVVDGRVYATGTVSGKGSYQTGRLWTSNPTLPPLDRTYYNNLIAQAAARPAWNVEMRGGGSYGDTGTYQSLINQANSLSPWNLEVRSGNQYTYPLYSGQPDPTNYGALLAAADATPRWDLELRASGTYGDTATYQALLADASLLPRQNKEKIKGTYILAASPELINGDLYIRPEAVLIGPGVLVATGRVIIERNVTFNGDVRIVAGQTITFEGTLRGSGSTLLYAFEAPASGASNLNLATAPLVSVGSTSVRAFAIKGDLRLRGAPVVTGPGWPGARAIWPPRPASGVTCTLRGPRGWTRARRCSPVTRSRPQAACAGASHACCTRTSRPRSTWPVAPC
jgi:type II secretory pathway pseudopilin PulG